MKGKVKWYDIKKGYGFITSEDGKDIFIHKNEVPYWNIFLNKGDKVNFIKKNTHKGIEATNIKVI